MIVGIAVLRMLSARDHSDEAAVEIVGKARALSEPTVLYGFADATVYTSAMDARVLTAGDDHKGTRAFGATLARYLGQAVAPAVLTHTAGRQPLAATQVSTIEGQICETKPIPLEAHSTSCCNAATCRATSCGSATG